MCVLADIVHGQLAAHHPEDPDGIGDNDRQEYDSGPEHPGECQVARHSVPHREAVARVGAGWHDKRKHGKARSQHHRAYADRARDQCHSRPGAGL